MVQKNVSAMGYTNCNGTSLSTDGRLDAKQYIVDLPRQDRISHGMHHTGRDRHFIFTSIRKKRRHRSGIGAALVIGFSYWFVLRLRDVFGAIRNPFPFMAAWLANAFFGVASVLMMRRCENLMP